MAQTLKLFATHGSLLVQGHSRTRSGAQLAKSHTLYGCDPCASVRAAHWLMSWNLSSGLAGRWERKPNWNGKFPSFKTLQFKINLQSQKRSRAVVSASLAGPATVEVAASLFQLATAFVVPFYTVMILAPKWIWTQKLMESELTYFILGAGYIYLLCLSWTPETLGLMFSSKYWLPELSGITRMFASSLTVASAWLHLLAADLFAGRQVFLDGVKNNVETRHSLVLCLMMCPIGIFSHLITKSLTLILRRAQSQDDVTVTTEFPSY